MSKKLIKKLDTLIGSGNFAKEACSFKEWDEAGVIISSQSNDDIKERLGPLFPEQRRIEVATEFSRELSWLFHKIRDIFPEEKDFYGELAQAANVYLKENKKNPKCNQLMYYV